MLPLHKMESNGNRFFIELTKIHRNGEISNAALEVAMLDRVVPEFVMRKQRNLYLS